jgi:hypothetical protein
MSCSDPFGTVMRTALMRNCSTMVHNNTVELNRAAETASSTPK